MTTKVDDSDQNVDAFSAEREGIAKRERVFTKVMVESLPGSFSINDVNGQLVWWNSYYREQVLGKDEREMFSTNALEVIHPDDRAFALEKMLNVLNLGIEETGEARVLLRGGPKFQWRMITGRKIVVDEEPFVVAVSIDITERKRFEALSAFRLCLHEMGENASLEVLLRATIDEVERITESSIGFFHIVADDQTTFSKRVFSTGTQMLDAGPSNTTPNEDKLLADVLQKRELVIDNTYNASLHCDGATDIDPATRRILVLPVIQGTAVTALLCVGGKSYDYDEDDAMMATALVNFAWDIVSRKRAELSEKKIQESLVQAQKMELVGQLAGGIAHDFNNMLGVILGNVEMAIHQLSIDGPLLENMKAILRATEQSSILCNQLIAFSRKQCVMPLVLDLNVMVERMLAVLRRLIGENITLIWLPHHQSTSIKIDPAQIDLILGNLCVNSRDAIEGIGKITIKTGRMHVYKAECVTGHCCKVPGDYVTLSVTDNGCGIEKKDLPHLFEPFFTTKKKRIGTGMGLATIYGILKQNGAFIECLSEPGRGTTFSLWFPRSVGYADPNESDFSVLDGQNKVVVLLVEDEPDILSICKLMLENGGYRVLDATSPSEAIRIAEEHKGEIQLLVTDVVLPEMNGCDLSKRVQITSPNLKTLFMSGYSSDIVENEGKLDRGVNYLQKPFPIKSLLVAVQKILNPP